MIYWLGINIISNDTFLLDNIENIIPNPDDVSLWVTDAYVLNRSTNLEDNGILNTSLYFTDLEDRTTFYLDLKDVDNISSTTISGSFIKMSNCYNDEKINGLFTKLDELTFEEYL